MTGWTLVYDDLDPKQEGLREALCTLGNGYFATRGALEFSDADHIHYPGTYLAGCYNRLKTEINGHVIENEDLVNLPNWLPLTFRIHDEPWFDLSTVTILEYRQSLDIKRGILQRSIRFRDPQQRETLIASRRLVHLALSHLAATEMTITATNWSGRIEIRSALNGRVTNAGVGRYRSLDNQHLEPLHTRTELPDIMVMHSRTNQSHTEIGLAARTQLFHDRATIISDVRRFEQPGYIAHYLLGEITPQMPIRVEKVIALYHSRDPAISECSQAAYLAVSRAGRFETLLQTHQQAWSHLWERFDIELDGDGRDERHKDLLILRLHTFHLLQVASPHIMDMDVGVPARGLHGEAYRGHIFWDELFVFPLLNLHLPDITRALLRYRYRRLSEARAAANHAGFRGAMFPWQSGSNGREESQALHLNPKSGRWLPDHTHLQRHINAAIAYNVWLYYQATRDLEFMSSFGAELIIEIARFWASICHYNIALDRYEILGVVGPDEYHTAYPEASTPGLNNNAYTNLMAVWVCCRALDVLKLLPAERSDELREKLAVTDHEYEQWLAISHKMRLIFHDDGIISQFEGYDALEEFDWHGYQQQYGNIQRLDRILEAEGDSPNRYKCSKQADVLMLFYLFSSDELRGLFERLGYPFTYDTIPKNVEYYMARTSHGSTLSNVVHAWVLIRGDRERSWQLFAEALESDIADVQGGTTAEGIHLGAMAGTVDVVQRGYTGIEMHDDILYLNPRLPQELSKLDLSLRYRDHTLSLNITQQEMVVLAAPSAAAPISISVNNHLYELCAGEVKRFDRGT